MSLFPRRSRLFPLLLGASAPVLAQGTPPPAAAPAPAVAVDTSPWLYKGSDIPQDKEWRFGTLPNGLRYAVRRNGLPPGQVAVRVRVDAGSLEETEAQRGFAHFIEHLSFRGSEYVPDGEAKRTWQRLGATFGTDQNAQTTPTQTVYQLNLPGVTPASLDESMKILSGLMEHPNIVPAAVNAERPVVLAEQREQPAPQVRFDDALRQTFFAGQPLADRSPIGNIKTLEAATAASVQAYHDRWYRPERTVVVAVGDMDPDLLAQTIVKHFAGWKGVGPTPPADPDFGKPDPGKPATATTVEPTLPGFVATAVVRPWHFNNDTVIFNQKRMVDQIAVQVINRRLEARARAGGSFVQASVSLDDVSRSANVTFANIVPLGDRWELALKDVRAVIADAMASPASRAEVEREVSEYNEALHRGVETAPVQTAVSLADDMVSALDIRETTTSPQASYDIFAAARAKGMFTPASVLASTRRIFTGDASRALVNLHAPDPAAAPKLAAALKADVSKLAGKRVEQAAVSFAKLPPLPPAGSVASTVNLAGEDLQAITYANGVRLLLYPNPGDAGRVFVRVRWGGGYNALPADRAAPVWAAELALVASGIGKLNQGDLDALTTGRAIGMDFDIDDDAFTLSAITSPGDVADQLKLMADKLYAPAWDPAPVERAKAVVLTGYPGYDGSPSGVLSRDLEGLLHDGDPRWGTPPKPVVEGTTPGAFRHLWEPLLKQGPIEVPNVAAVSRIASAAMTPPPVRFPAHNTTPVLRTHDGQDNQAAAVIAWPTGGGIGGVRESRRLDVLAQVFSDRLFERLRQAAGASYSPSVQNSWPVGLASGGRLVAIGQVAPDKVPYFFQTARAIAAELATQPIGQDELQRILGPIRQVLLRSSTSSQFWLRQFAGGAFDPRRIAAVRGLLNDYVDVTPAQLQETAAKYLRPETDWTMEVLPKSVAAKTGGGTPVAAR